MIKGKTKYIILFSLFLILISASLVSASSVDEVMSKWNKSEVYRESGGASLTIGITYYSAEYIEALVQDEAEKNLWTKDETENYKYNLLQTLNIEETLPFHVYIKNIGPGLHLAPFGDQLTLWAGDKKLKPVDYDKRFNFKVTGEREGLVYFPRYDENGRSVLEGVKSIRLVFYNGISPATMGKTVDFIWDVYKDDPQRLYAGQAGAKLEIDRLIKRVQKLETQKNDLEAQLAEVNADLAEINARIEELRSQ